jgi:hypothetical protein
MPQLDLEPEVGSDLYPGYDGRGEMADIVKKAGFVTLGSIAGSYLAKGIGRLTPNIYIASGIEAALGVGVAVFAGRQYRTEPLLWGGIGVTSHGIATMLAALIPVTP